VQPALSTLAPAYRPRRPTETVLYSVVRDYLETFLAHARDSYEAPLPRYVEEELRGYLRCGVFAHGFVRAHCDTCGHDLLVAFSCKARSVCPSCAGRRMANTAANLVDRVLPAVPVRQWVLSLPWELRALAAFKADVLSALARIFVEAIFARHLRWAKERGLGEARSGAVTHVQRFGSSVNLNVHFHVMVLDGVFTREEPGHPLFHPAPPPTRAELDQVVRHVHRRAVAWLARAGHLGASSEARSQDAHAQTSLDACAAVAMGRGAVRAIRDDPGAPEDGATGVDTPPADGSAVDHDGFNLHASVAIGGDDDLGRERLMRYGARPPLALDRLRRLPGGRIAYRIKKLRDGRAKHRVMTPLEFLARLAAIVPPPRYPLLRYHGVLGPRSSWRRDVVPTAPKARSCEQRPPTKQQVPEFRPDGARDGACEVAQRPGASREHSISTPAPTSVADTPAVLGGERGTGAAPPKAVMLTPNVLSTKHWSRLLGGALYAASPRVDWATLLRRSFDVDVLRCAGCGGRLRVLGEVTEPSLVRVVLESLGLPPDAPPVARARDPTDLLGAEVD
jgi:hypothetical protein